MDQAQANGVTLRNVFSQHASTMQKQISAANQFIDHITSADAKPEGKVLETGFQLLRKFSEKQEVYLHSGSALAGQEAQDDKDLDAKLEALSRTLEVAQATRDRLDMALKKYA